VSLTPMMSRMERESRNRAGRSCGWLALSLVVMLGASAGAARATTLFALVNTGEVYSSTNQGTNWSALAALPVHDAVGVMAGSTSAQLFLAAADGGFYASTNAGVNWSGVGSAPASDVCGLLLLPDLSLRLLTISGLVYISTDGGVTFSGQSTLNASNFVALAQVPVSQNLYALTRSGEIYESVDSGTTWTGKGAFAASDAVGLQGMGISLFAVTSSGDVYQSNDRAASWLGVGTLSEVGVTTLTRDGGTLVAGLGTGEVATSPDGNGWTWKGTVNQVTVRSLGSDTPLASSVGPGARNSSFVLDTPWPNPLLRGQSINLQLRLTVGTDVGFELYDAAGRRVTVRPPRTFAAGITRLSWTPTAAEGSVYFLRMTTASGQTAGQRIVVVP
jgi:hypothetical protein